MGTSLIEELELAAKAADDMAADLRIAQRESWTTHALRAARLRARAEQVRELEPGPDNCSPPAIELYARLTGDLPAVPMTTGTKGTTT